MNNIEIKINKSTKMVDLSKTIIGNEGENKQGNLIFTFDEFVEGQARLEFEIDGVLDIVYPQKVGESYQLPILSKLTKKGQINMQLVITSGTSEEEVTIFKSNVFYVYCNYSINADEEQPEEYLSWIEIANTKLNQMDNLDISVKKSEDKTILTITKKDGLKQVVEIFDGTLYYDKLKNLPKFNGKELKGEMTYKSLGIQPSGNYVTKEELPNITESDPSVPQHVKNITEEDIEKWNNPSLPNDLFIPTKLSQLTNDKNFVVGNGISKIIAITQSEYDSLEIIDSTALYVVVE